MTKTLPLTIKKQWFDLIRSGEKTEEYREIKDFWCRRLLTFGEELEGGVFDEMMGDLARPGWRHDGVLDAMGYFGVSFKEYDAIEFRNGYSPTSPRFIAQLKGIEIKQGIEAWGAEKDKFYFVLTLGVTEAAKK